MSSARFIVGDTRAVTATLPDDSVDLVLTSPPFLALRSYLPADDSNKPFEIGSEPNPATFLDVLLELTEEWGRVLTPHGSICVELGDTYSGSGGAGGDFTPGSGTFDRFNPDTVEMPAKRDTSTGWPLAKSLCLIPQLYAASLAYGHNLLNPAHQFDPWRIRNIVRWVRPNPPVGALGDKFRPATSEMIVACRSKDRWFDLDAVRQPLADSPGNKYPRHRVDDDDARGAVGANKQTNDVVHPNPAGAPPLDWWEIPTHPYKGAHYATWPPELCVKPIEAMCPREVCETCGEPRRRIVGEAEYVDSQTGEVHAGIKWASGILSGSGAHTEKRDGSKIRQAPTLGWTDCGHDNYRPGTVLDPFAGSGTTLAVATGHSRDAIGIDLDPRNADLAHERIGMFVTVEHHKETAT